ncbi:hypothetical protein C7H85_04365 [Zobellella endophytica]|uniref:DNA-binding protein n=1 Tax=Zobellella endophytica TaxID=2116700 RepID=A0A2P7RCS5_9GAMM|nr:hypothetical protein [Zobellella endophytica]PSJ48038.1 hypothetical protein C7H85_04365 [Zobellella endophytica]
MKPIEIAEKIMQESPDVLGTVPANRAARIIRAAFEQLVIELQNTDEGKVTVPKLGNFIVRRVDTEKNGEKVQVKRIIFRPVALKTEE